MEEINIEPALETKPVIPDLCPGDVFALPQHFGLALHKGHGDYEAVTLPKETYFIAIDCDVEATGKRMITISKLIDHKYDPRAPVFTFEQTEAIEVKRREEPTLSFSGEPWYMHLIREGKKPKDFKGEE